MSVSLGLTTIKRNADFRTVFKEGRSAANREMAVYVRRNRLAYDRYGFSVSKKIGKAVVRNKIRRRLKEIARQAARDETRDGRDVVIIARKAITGAGYNELKAGLESLTARLSR